MTWSGGTSEAPGVAGAVVSLAADGAVVPAGGLDAPALPQAARTSAISARPAGSRMAERLLGSNT